jgi:hypothetical protein
VLNSGKFSGGIVSELCGTQNLAVRSETRCDIQQLLRVGAKGHGIEDSAFFPGTPLEPPRAKTVQTMGRASIGISISIAFVEFIFPF